MGGEGSTTRREALRASALALALLAADGPPATAGVRHRRHGKHHKPASTRHPGVSKLLPDPHTVAARGGSPADLGLLECASLLQAGLLSSRELTGACLARIEQRNDPLNAWVRIYASDALAAAAAADQQLAAARSGRCKPGSLVVGAPIGLKDLYPVAGQLLTASSRILAGNRATVDCPVWASLATAGMVLLGHTAMHEFAAGNFTPQCSNPWDHARTPGGSSGGSAIALAARMLPAATGSDTLGSLRIPASICGVSALKPTRGLVSTRNLIPLARSFDHAGPLARSAGDLALMLAYMRSPGGTPGYLVRPARSRRPLAGVRIGIPDQTFGGLSPTAAIAARVESFGRELEQLGATRVPFTAPRSPADNLSSPSGTQFFLTVPGAEINRYHSRYFPQRALEYTPDVRVLLGLLRAANTVPSDPRTGSTTIAQLAASWARTFTIHRLDAVLQPAALIETPKKANAFAQTMSIGDPMVVWDYTGFPALCVPAGRSAATGLPIGVQLAGAPGSERRLLRIGIEAQAHYPHHKAAPPGLA